MTATTEAARQAAVRSYAILDTPTDGSFDNITSLAAYIFDVPIALVTIVDHDRIWFKSRHGLDVEQIGREPGLCASAILQDAPWIVTDAKLDPRCLANPLVAGEFGLRFYAAAPLTTSEGYRLGTLCVIDKEPRQVSDAQMKALQDLAAVVVDELELRLAARKTVQLRQELYERTIEQKAQAEQRFQQAFDNAPIGMAILSADLLLVEVNAAFCDMIGRREPNLLLTAIADLVHPDDREACLSTFAKLRSGELSNHKAEWRCLNAGGQVVCGRVSLATVVEGPEKRPTRFIAQFEDVTERNAAPAIRKL